MSVRLSVVIVMCCQVEVLVTGRLIAQRSPKECGVFECDLGTSTMRRSSKSGKMGAL